MYNAMQVRRSQDPGLQREGERAKEKGGDGGEGRGKELREYMDFQGAAPLVFRILNSGSWGWTKPPVLKDTGKCSLKVDKPNLSPTFLCLLPEGG